MNDEFYIGWEDKAPARIGSRVRRAVVLLLLTTFVLGAGLALTQRTIGVSVFEWGKVKEFSGILKSQPYPHLLVPRRVRATANRIFLLLPGQAFKFGLDPQTVSRFDGATVSLRGTLIYRDNQTMIEVGAARQTRSRPEGIARVTGMTNSVMLGRQTLVGEIVDSKCTWA